MEEILEPKITDWIFSTFNYLYHQTCV